MPHCNIKEINVEIELATQSARRKPGQSYYPIRREKDTKLMKLKTDYELECGACLRITDIFSNGCLYEEYGTEINLRSKYPAQDSPRRVGFAKWNERVSIFVPHPPTDLICNLYVTFKVPESEKQSLTKTEFILPESKPDPEKDQEWICPNCGAAISAGSTFCYNCKRATVRGFSLTSKYNIAAEPDDDETMWRCSACGTFNRFINTHCSNCGQSR